MKRGQTTLEFVILVGFVAAGLIAMLFYIGRGHQGHLRAQAEQLGARQYEPGNTRAANRDTKHVTKAENMASSTVTKRSKHPTGETNVDLEKALADKAAKLGELYMLMDNIDKDIGPEGLKVAREVAGGTWPWVPPGGGVLQTLEQIKSVQDDLKLIDEAIDTAIKKWPKREKNESHSGSLTSENGSITTDRHTDETLGDFSDRVKKNIR
jgi:hypothetical protein